MIVLDTHVWLRWIIQDGRGLPASILAAIQSEPRVAVSAISCFEVPYLLKRRRISLPLPAETWLRDALSPAGIESLPVSWEIAFRSAQLPEHHRDPADRIIIATALAYDAHLASLDGAFPHYEELARPLDWRLTQTCGELDGMATGDVHLFGIRHHGPGCARSLARALEELQPDCLLIEGPPEADSLLDLAGAEDMAPPVALLLYAPEQPRHAVFYPFAEFSPEWQALRYAVRNGVPARFMDLPQTHALALAREHEAAAALAQRTALEARDLPVLTELVDHLLLSDLPAALAVAMRELENRAALTGDRDFEQRFGGAGRLAPALLQACSVRTDTPSRRTNSIWVISKRLRASTTGDPVTTVSRDAWPEFICRTDSSKSLQKVSIS